MATYTANDPEDGEITWTFVGRLTARTSQISAGGELTFKTAARLRGIGGLTLTTNNVYEVTVEASDGEHTDTLDVRVTVTDAERPAGVPAH